MKYIINNMEVDIELAPNVIFGSTLKSFIESGLSRGYNGGKYKKGDKIILEWTRNVYINYIHKLYAEANN